MAKSKPQAEPPKRKVIPTGEIEPLNLRERTKLNEMLNDPAMVRALDIAQRSRPSAFIVNEKAGSGSRVLDAALSQAASNNRLHEMRGWDSYEAAIYSQLIETAKRTETVQETYPNAGRID